MNEQARRERDDGVRFSIAHISDLHCGSQHFQPELLERAIEEINELHPNVTIISGDLTTDGFKAEYEVARDYIDRIESDDLIVVPGNHDSRNVGYVHFEELFGPRTCELHKNGVSIVAVDSSEPDLDHGQIGRNRYRSIDEQFGRAADLRIFVLHHHLIPVPGTGRERNVVYDAGDLLEVLLRCGVNLVLCGHKHVPYAWKLEDLFIVTAGTASSLRLRGHTRPCYNIVEIGRDRVSIYRKYPFDIRELIVEFSPGTDDYAKAELISQRVVR
jgi:3',5'-cyclic-AMP phosphodiesterase